MTNKTVDTRFGQIMLRRWFFQNNEPGEPGMAPLDLGLFAGRMTPALTEVVGRLAAAPLAPTPQPACRPSADKSSQAKAVPPKLPKNPATELTAPFVHDAADRLDSRVQLTSDGLKIYVDAEHISTSYVERQNLTMRMSPSAIASP